MGWIEIPDTASFWLQRARVPATLLASPNLVNSDLQSLEKTPEGLALVDLKIADGCIAAVQAHRLDATKQSHHPKDDSPVVDLRGGQVWPCFADIHTHLDKGHILPRTPNPDGTFETALDRARADRVRHWHAEDLYRRMEFGLKCSYAHGTCAVRTHLDSFQEQSNTSWGVFRQLRQEWQGRIELQAVSIHPLELYLTAEGEALADLIAESGGIMGGVPLMGSNLEAACDRLFELATNRNLDIDLHVDESGNPNDLTLQAVARATLKHGYESRVVCGHCCSLGVQPPATVSETLKLVSDAGIGVVSLPQCNLYLQDRQQAASSSLLPSAASQSSPLEFPNGTTPRWRGVTLLHELRAAGVPVAVASDNCRDPFHAFGDHDMMDVFGWAVKVAHLDMPYGDWPAVVTETPAQLMKLQNCGAIAEGAPANLVLFRGRNYSELLARHQGDRVVLRNGKAIDTALPPYEELDDLMQNLA